MAKKRPERGHLFRSRVKAENDGMIHISTYGVLTRGLPTAIALLSSSFASGREPVGCLVGLSELNHPILGFYLPASGRDLPASSDCSDVEVGFVLVTGQIHGDERATGAMLRAILSNGSLGSAAARSNIPMLVVPTVNVDGDRADSRVNALNIDINRNFSSRLLSPALTRRLLPVEYPGPFNYISREASEIMNLIRRARFYLDVHGYRHAIYAPVVSAGFGEEPVGVIETITLAADLMRAEILRAFGLDYRITDGVTEGDVGASEDYAAAMGVPAISFEMPPAHADPASLSDRVLEGYASIFTSLVAAIKTDIKSKDTVPVPHGAARPSSPPHLDGDLRHDIY